MSSCYLTLPPDPAAVRGRSALHTLLVGGFLVAGALNGWGGHLDDIGLTALQAELGGGTPTGSGISVSQVEAAYDGANYAASANNSELVGKTFSLQSGASVESVHATTVARSFCGSVNGVAPDITQIDAYEVNGWLQSDFLRFGSSSTPRSETRRIQNHSWIANTIGSQSQDQDILRRLDYAIQRDSYVAVVGVNNFTTNPVPALMAQAYNSIAVGNDNGNHSTGGTTFDVAGRLKPDIVAPSAFGAVSYSIGTVSGAAALLLETADGVSALANARNNPEVIKALLLAGATKSPFPGWTRTPTQPLDTVYGAGRVNIQRSYHLLVAGEFAASGSVTRPNQGWDFASVGSGPARYFFDVPSGSALTNFSVVLTWNRDVSDGAGPGFNPQVSVADMNLRLYSASGFSLGAQLDSSVSTIQNVEHVFTSLGPGRYALEVTSNTSGVDYALAWGGTLQAEIATSVNQPAWGSVTPASGFYTVGDPVSFTASPSQYYLFDQWSGDLSGGNNPVPVTLSSNMTVAALFVEQLTTNYPTPYWWLAQYGYTSNQETVVTNTGANGYPLWQSYIAGLVPTDPASQLRFTSLTLPDPSHVTLTWDTVTGRVYTVWNSTNASGGFEVLSGAADLPWTIQSVTTPIVPGVPRSYYRLEVETP
jgi:hypothetical protein